MQLVITATAADKVHGFIKDHGESEDTGLRVAVLPGGCSGFQYGLNIEDAPETEDEIVEHCRTRIADFKVPSIIEFRDELPMSSVGKVLRRELREMNTT